MEIPKAPPLKMTKRTAKAIAAVTAAVVGAGTASVIQAIAIYNSFFPRYERPDPSQTPGMYIYERYEDTLPRETFFIPSGENRLCAYYYPVEQPKALAVTVHGIHAGGDDLLPIIEWLVGEGYAVLSYDATGTYSSTGEDGIGMCQFICDLDAVLNYLSDHPTYSAMPRVLVGHSLGGNAVASVLSLHSEVKAAACIAPMADASTLMVETARQRVGDLAATIKPLFDAYQEHLFGDYTQLNAIRGINDSGIPVLIAHGVEDETIPHDSLGVTARLSEITNPNVTVCYTKGWQASHTGVWHSVDAMQYAERVAQDVEGLSDEEKAAYYATVDHRRYSAVNEVLMMKIDTVFEKALAE